MEDKVGEAGTVEDEEEEVEAEEEREKGMTVGLISVGVGSWMTGVLLELEGFSEAKSLERERLGLGRAVVDEEVGGLRPPTPAERDI